jgi:hypothetical protein
LHTLLVGAAGAVRGLAGGYLIDPASGWGDQGLWMLVCIPPMVAQSAAMAVIPGFVAGRVSGSLFGKDSGRMTPLAQAIFTGLAAPVMGYLFVTVDSFR